MNRKQRWVILLGFVVIVLMGFYPPWLKTSRLNRDGMLCPVVTDDGVSFEECEPEKRFVTVERFAGHKFLLLPRMQYFARWEEEPADEGGEFSYYDYFPRRVDCSLLLVQWFLVSAVTGIIVMFLGDRSQKSENSIVMD